jgi:hypothetical protein
VAATGLLAAVVRAQGLGLNCYRGHGTWKRAFAQPHPRETFMHSLALRTVAAVAVLAAGFGLYPQVRLGDCHSAGGISVQHKDGTYWCTGGICNGPEILIF